MCKIWDDFSHSFVSVTSNDLHIMNVSHIIHATMFWTVIPVFLGGHLVFILFVAKENGIDTLQFIYRMIILCGLPYGAARIPEAYSELWWTSEASGKRLERLGAARYWHDTDHWWRQCKRLTFSKQLVNKHYKLLADSFLLLSNKILRWLAS